MSRLSAHTPISLGWCMDTAPMAEGVYHTSNKIRHDRACRNLVETIYTYGRADTYQIFC